LVCDLVSGGPGGIASANEVAVLFAQFAEAFEQDFAIAFGIEWFFFDFVSDELHDVVVHELDTVKVSAAEAEDFESGDGAAPGEEVGAGRELGPFAEDNDISFLEDFFGVSWGVNEGEDGEVEGALSGCEQSDEFFIRA
jgi:hypothetical protein